MRKRYWKLISVSLVATSSIGTLKYLYEKRKKKSGALNSSGALDFSSVNGYAAVRRLKELDLLNELKCHLIASQLPSAGWCLLAMENHPAFRLYRPRISWTSTDSDDVSTLLTKLKLDAQWLSALNWYLTNICTDEDLYCQESSPIVRESSKRERYVKLLRILLYKSELEDCDKLVEENILQVLYQVLEEHWGSARLHVSTTVLKILSNVARKSTTGAQQICDSPILGLLHTMIHRPSSEEEAILANKVCMNAIHTLGVRGAYALLPSVYEFHRPPIDVAPALDVVFVHGLRGTAFRTWRQRDGAADPTTSFWPKKWLADDVTRPIRILAIDYSSRLLRFGSVMETISARSQKFQNELADADVGNRPVIFVCHSMGGLLVKHMLLNNERLLSRTIGVLFMSTPHHGSPLAGYGIVRPSDDLQLLRVDSETNRQLDTDFKQLAVPRIPVFGSVLELRETPILGIKHFIVPHESAVLGHGAVYHVDAHHHHVCKPTSRDDVSYAIVLNFVREALRLAQSVS